MPNHHIALGRIVHYLAEDYECPAMIVGTPRHFEDPLDVEMAYGRVTTRHSVSLQVHHPWNYEVRDTVTDEVKEIAMVVVVHDAKYEAKDQDEEHTWHWADECNLDKR